MITPEELKAGINTIKVMNEAHRITYAVTIRYGGAMYHSTVKAHCWRTAWIEAEKLAKKDFDFGCVFEVLPVKNIPGPITCQYHY